MACTQVGISYHISRTTCINIKYNFNTDYRVILVQNLRGDSVAIIYHQFVHSFGLLGKFTEQSEKQTQNFFFWRNTKTSRVFSRRPQIYGFHVMYCLLAVVLALGSTVSTDFLVWFLHKLWTIYNTDNGDRFVTTFIYFVLFPVWLCARFSLLLQWWMARWSQSQVEFCIFYESVCVKKCKKWCRQADYWHDMTTSSSTTSYYTICSSHTTSPAPALFWCTHLNFIPYSAVCHSAVY